MKKQEFNVPANSRVTEHCYYYRLNRERKTLIIK